MRKRRIWEPLARAIAAAGTDEHLDRLIDLIGWGIPHESVTVTRYSATETPEFIKHRQFSDEMVRRYLALYYVFDPFYAAWRRDRRPGIMPLKSLADDEVKRGRYSAEFLAQSEISDEVGILLEDGGDWCLGIFLDRAAGGFRDSEIALLIERLPVFTALHARHLTLRTPEAARRTAPEAPGTAPRRQPTIPEGLWHELSQRERQLVQLVLTGYPTAAIAEHLGIAVGTVKNHRRRIYEKLDITTERELFLQFFQYHDLAG